MIADQEIRQVFYREQKRTSIPHPPGKDAAAPVVNSRPLRDIRYRGFLTFRGLRLVALIFMSLSQLSMLLVPAARICVVYDIPFLFGNGIVRFLEIAGNLGQASFALLMVSSIGLVVNRQVSFKRMLIEYFLMALFTYLATVFIIAQTIRTFLYGLPSAFPAIQEIMSQVNGVEMIKGLLSNTAKLVIPGDGSVHIGVLNNIMSVFGAKITLPEIDQIINTLPETLFSHEEFMEIVSMLATMDVTPLMSSTVDAVLELLNNLPPEFLIFLQETVFPRIESIIGSMMNMNMFWNLFLYTLFYFFVVYEPANLKAGKKMLFRCCAVFPGFWLVLSFFISTELRMSGALKIPIWFVALLSNVRPSTLALFFLLVVFERYNELEYTQRDDNRLSLTEYFQSRNASLQFSVGTSLMIIFICVIDYLLGMIPRLDTWGFGKSTMMWLCIPAVMLYSFNKMPKHKVLNGVVPLYYLAHYAFIVFMWMLILIFMLGSISGVVQLPEM